MNYSNEEKKSIEIVKRITEDDLLNYWEGPEEPYNAIQIILNLIQKQEKIIDKMAEQIDKFNSSSGLDEDCFITREYSSIDDCIKKQSCKECIKEYFKKEVEKDVKD